jgi:hypothetical protein
LLIAALLVVVAVVGIGWAARGWLSTTRAELRAVTAPITPGRCHSVDGLPDPSCTPGVADPRVTQDNILTTICVGGYTKKVRPSSLYTNALKRKQIEEYGYADTNPADYEEDHLIPLELGGHPTDPKNLWPEPLSDAAHPATKKDGVENSLNTTVCAGLMTLAAAQAAIAKNWQSASAARASIGILQRIPAHEIVALEVLYVPSTDGSARRAAQGAGEASRDDASPAPAAPPSRPGLEYEPESTMCKP